MTGTRIQDWINQSPERVSFRQAVHTILVAITRSTTLKTNMVMKGGILLALGYESTRYTKDIDFSTEKTLKEFDIESFISELRSALIEAVEQLSYGLDCRIQSYKQKPPKSDATFPTIEISVGYAYKHNRNAHRRLLKGNSSDIVEIDYSLNEPSRDIEILEIEEGTQLRIYGFTELVAEKYRAILQQVSRNRRRRQDVKLLVMETLNPTIANEIDWTAPRLICIAADFSKYDEHAVKQINRNIDLVRYRHFEDGLLALELAHRNQSASIPYDQVVIEQKHPKKTTDKPVSQWLKELDTPMSDLYESLRALLLALGDDVDEKQLKLYIAFRRIKNFACIVFQKKSLMVYVKLNPDTVRLEDHFTRDVRNIGHWATGDLEITIIDKESLAKAQPLLIRAYEES